MFYKITPSRLQPSYKCQEVQILRNTSSNKCIDNQIKSKTDNQNEFKHSTILKRQNYININLTSVSL